MKKKYVLVSIIVLLLAAIIIISIVVLGNGKNTKNQNAAGKSILLELEKDSDYTCIYSEESLTQAPESFKVADSDTIYICDTYGNRILKYSGRNLISTIPVNVTGTIIDFDIKGDNVYLLSDTDYIYITDMSGKIKSSSKLKFSLGNAEKISVNDSEIIIYNMGSLYKLKTNKLADEVTFSNNDIINTMYSKDLADNKIKITNKNGDSKYIEPTLGYKIISVYNLKDVENKSFYRISEYRDDNNVLNRYILSLENLNNEVTYKLLPIEFFLPKNDICIDDEGNVYQMVVYEDILQIVKLA